MALFGNKCSLCGGRLDSNKRCIECGLDNTKNDDRYKGMMNRNVCDGEPLTHVHEEPIQRKSKYKSINKQYKKPVYTQSRNQKKTKKPLEFGKIIGVIVVILGIIPSIFNLITNIADEQQYTYSEEIGITTSYENYLEPGMYTIGVHLPEGTYDIELATGDYGSIDILENIDGYMHMVDFYSLDWRNNDGIVEDVYLYAGEILDVSAGCGVYVYSYDSDNSYYEMENPNASNYVITGAAVAGVDFPAGVYDVYYDALVEGEAGGVYFELYNEVQEQMHVGYEYFEYDWGPDVYRNVPLAEGSVISVENLSEITISSSWIIDPKLEWIYETNSAQDL